MLHIIVALEQDGLNARILILPFEVTDTNIDLESAVRKAATAYCKTPEGKEMFAHNCPCFNWGDFNRYVPQSTCEQFGFRKVEIATADCSVVNWDEQLVEKLQY